MIDNEKYREFDGERRMARGLCAGYLAYTMGVSIRTAYDKYTDEEKIGWFWIELARVLFLEVPNSAFKAIEPIVPGPLQ